MTAHASDIIVPGIFLWFNSVLSISRYTLEVPRCGIQMVVGF